MTKIILASSSLPRKKLLKRLKLTFSVIKPNIDEKKRVSESITDMVVRLAKTKAEVVALKHPQAIVIGADQVCSYRGKVIGKPYTHENAIKQLTFLSGKKVVFYSGLAITKNGGRSFYTKLNTSNVSFRKLTINEIEAYLKIDKPYKCAGSIKSESLGVSLCSSIKSDDPTSLIGLPLIEICARLNIPQKLHTYVE